MELDKTVTECKHGGTVMRFIVPVAECKDIEGMVDQYIIVQSDKLIIKGTLDKVNTKKIKEDGEIDIWKEIFVKVESFRTIKENQEVILLAMPDVKDNFQNMVSIDTLKV